MFSTLTNVNFDADRFHTFLQQADELKQKAKAMYEQACEEKNVTPESLEEHPAAGWRFDADKSNAELSTDGQDFGVFARKLELGADLTGLHELCIYGLKGLAAYAEHAQKLGKTDPEVFAFIHRALSDLASTSLATPAGDLLTLALECGKYNLRVTELLDEAHRETFGTPAPIAVRRTPVKGKCVLITGHDMKDLHDLLTQLEGTDINVYTHGEMMPAHSYPGLKKYKNLAGHYGGAWQNQKNDFARFPGPIVATSNCIIEPRKSYKHRLFTRDVAGWPGVHHLKGNDYSKVIENAKAEEGFTEDGDASQTTTIGFGHDAVLGLADTIVKMVQDGEYVVSGVCGVRCSVWSVCSLFMCGWCLRCVGA
jgi:hydroxylamine reductase